MSIEFEIAEIKRLIGNILRFAKITELDLVNARVKAVSGDLDTPWLPWLTQRAGADRDWWAPTVGEQVLLLSPGGDPARGVVLPALYQSAHAAPSNDANKHRIEYSDGAVIEYDRAAHALHVTLPSGGMAQIDAPGGVTINTNGNAAITAGGSVSVHGGSTVAIDAAISASITAPTIALNGNTTIAGTLTGTAGSGGGGTATFSGNISTTADVLAGGKSLKTHTHSGVQTDSGNTGAPN